MRFEEMEPGRWTVTWAFPLGAEAATREGYGKGTLTGDMLLDPAFPGCPHCGDKHFVLCGQCQRVGCSAVEATWFDCPWCPNEGAISGTITRLDTVGD
jgi:hypothetical protein